MCHGQMRIVWFFCPYIGVWSPIGIYFILFWDFPAQVPTMNKNSLVNDAGMTYPTHGTYTYELCCGKRTQRKREVVTRRSGHFVKRGD